MLSPGMRLGPYEILEPIGAGGMGEVYRARDARLERDVAIKVLPEALARDTAALGRFEREAKSLAALSHPHLLAIFDVGSEGGVAYLVTELLEGADAAQPHGAPGALVARVGPHRDGHRGRPGGGAFARHRAPGPETRERLPDRGRARQDPRLRHRAARDAAVGGAGERRDGDRD